MDHWSEITEHWLVQQALQPRVVPYYKRNCFQRPGSVSSSLKTAPTTSSISRVRSQNDTFGIFCMVLDEILSVFLTCAGSTSVVRFRRGQNVSPWCCAMLVVFVQGRLESLHLILQSYADRNIIRAPCCSNIRCCGRRYPEGRVQVAAGRGGSGVRKGWRQEASG